MSPKPTSRGKKEEKPPSGRRLIGERYRIERELGRGGAGVVSLVQDQVLGGKKVALKVLKIQESQFALLSASLKNEFSTLSQFRHRNLARVYDFGLTSHEMYFSSEWVDGKDILTACRGANLNTAFQLIVQILRAIDFLHRRGVLHLDLKPPNILVTDPDRTGELSVKLIDFGIAQWKRRGHFTTAEFSGTPPYAAPEVIMQKEATPASDIYSLGMIFHQIFAKRFPFLKKEAFEIMQEQMYKDPLRLEDLNPALPDDFPDLLLKMVARDPTHRFQTPREVLEAINQCLGENYTLRSPTAPIKILEESDHLFRPELFEELMKTFSQKDPPLISLKGPDGIGKRYLMRRVKESLQLQGISPHFTQADQRPSPPSTEEIRDIHLSPLSPTQIGDFLKKEIVDGPISSVQEIAAIAEGLPIKLEDLLQAMREEGMIQWSDMGWSWKREAEVSLADLILRQERRWQERLQHVREILKFSRSGLTAPILEGILRLEAGALMEKLGDWERQGHLVKKEVEGAPLYFVPLPSSQEEPTVPFQDWIWAERELRRLYDEDQFESGAELARLIISNAKDGTKVPVGVSLFCARHLAAVGEAQPSLEALPKISPEDPYATGLFHETRARNFLALGRFQEAEKDLLKAEGCYHTAGDLVDLAAALNLKGRLQNLLGQSDQAERTFLEGIAKAKEAKDNYMLALLETSLGSLLHSLSRFDEAQEAYQRALSLSTAFHHPLLVCIIHHNRVNLLYQMGRASEAESSCFDWLKLSIRHRFPEQQALALNFLALLSGQKGHRAQQLAYLNQALGLLGSRKRPDRLAQFLINRAYAYFEMKKFVAAQLDGEAALEIAQKRSIGSLRSLSNLILGKILSHRPKPDLQDANEFLEKAYQTGLETQNRQILWEVNFERGILAKKQNHLGKAKDCLLESKADLKALLTEMPEDHKESYLRDRKLEKIEKELNSLENLAT